MILFEKYGQHQPLNRQAERYAREGVELSLSTLADQVGGCAMLLQPLCDLIRAQVLAAERLHGDDTTVPVLARHQTRTGRLWTYVRDDRPFAGHAPPAALFFYSRDRTAEHPERHLSGYAGILQADAYAGFNGLYASDRSAGAITEAACWAHARRKFFVLADITAKASGKLAVVAPLAFEAVKRIDLIFDVEREINGLAADQRLAARRARVAPLVGDLEAWMRSERARLSRHSEVAKAMDYMLKRWDSFIRFLADGRICLTNNAAERALRGIALGRKSWLFAGSDRGGERAAVMYTLIQTAKLNDVDPQAWLADVFARINDHNIQTLDQLLPWNWKAARARLAAPEAFRGLHRMGTAQTKKRGSSGGLSRFLVARFARAGLPRRFAPRNDECCEQLTQPSTGHEQALRFPFFQNRFRIILPSSRSDVRARSNRLSKRGAGCGGSPRCRSFDAAGKPPTREGTDAGNTGEQSK